MIIPSILDTDTYKCTMANAVLHHKQGTPVSYLFNNRRPEGKFNKKFLDLFASELSNMSQLALTNDEADWLLKTIPFLGRDFIEYLRNYRFDPKELSYELKDGELCLEINGTWERTILWEVPLMALISEIFFKTCDTNWKMDWDEQRERLTEKLGLLCFKEFPLGPRGNILSVPFADFGTRRRRSYGTQDYVISRCKLWSNFVGSSNMHLAHKHGVKPLGTFAHEWVMGISALEGLSHANRCAMQIWSDVYKGNMGTALTDTFGSNTFWNDFDGYLARLFDSVRQDSGDPYKFGEDTIEHYKKLGIDPKSKTIIFSDGLTTQDAANIFKRFHKEIKVSFGIGTSLTNDFPDSKPLNMVIKLAKCNGVPVVKLSDSPGKAIGDKDALRVARWTFFQTPLDAI